MRLSLTPITSRNDRQLVFTSSQAAGYLGVSLATVRRWTDAGHVACYRTPGGQRRFSRDQLDNFIASMHRDGNSGQSEGAAVTPSARVA
jgi:excisionase family DNA binding protein